MLGHAISRLGLSPRVRGTQVPADNRSRQPGLSPRVRGNRATPTPGSGASGSIPACAGEPGRDHSARDRIRVYPRVCGGTSTRTGAGKSPSGLSPRVRGNLHQPAHPLRHIGSIPACAGEPNRPPAFNHPAPVYPRVCGGTDETAPNGYRRLGLSPRVRGNHPSRLCEQIDLRSIPACAGEPAMRHLPLAPVGAVYPRVCGGNRSRCCANCHRYKRSIPACAGEPVRKGRRRQRCPKAVYPRVCGGTDNTFGAIPSALYGSIPACAGEPG